MDSLLFFQSFLIGLSIAAPVGPVGLLCIQRTLAHGPRVGFVSGLGAALADAVYGALGAFGIQGVIALFIAWQLPLRIAGALFLAWMGWRLLRAAPATEAAPAGDAERLLPALVSVFVLTLGNPMTIVSFVAVFASLGAPPAAASAGTMVGGVFIGSAAWWGALALGVSGFRQRLGTHGRRIINRAAGSFLLAFAVWQAVALFVGGGRGA